MVLKPVEKFTNIEAINFFLTNRFPRRLVTRLFGRISRIENRLFVKFSLWVWQRFTTGLNLDEAEATEFTSIQQCFIRRLKPGSRKVNLKAEYLTSPCDAIVGAYGSLEGLQALQIKGAAYSLVSLLNDEALANQYSDGRFLTLRLESTMYHRFHAPMDGRIEGLTYRSGDVWNVNSPALKRVAELFCKNERLIIPYHVSEPEQIVLMVPVAAVLVASIQLHGLDGPLSLAYKGPTTIHLNKQFRKGDEIGYFQHGSTILLFSSGGLEFMPELREGLRIQMGQPLMRVSQ